MTTYARVINNVAIETFSPPTGFSIADCFHADIAAQFQSVPDTVQAGWVLKNGTWGAPVPPSPSTLPYAPLSAMQFYLAFKPSERMAIKKSTDANVAEFWATFELAQSTGAHIDPNLTSVQESLQYLSVTNVTPAAAPAWAASTAVTVGQKVSLSNGATYQCTTAGTTGAAAPTGTGNAISDGSAVWEYVATPYIAAARITDILNGVAQ